MSGSMICPLCHVAFAAHQTPKQVAAALGCTCWTVGRLLRLGELSGLRIGRTWKICPSSVTAYVDRCMERSCA